MSMEIAISELAAAIRYHGDCVRGGKLCACPPTAAPAVVAAQMDDAKPAAAVEVAKRSRGRPAKTAAAETAPPETQETPAQFQPAPVEPDPLSELLAPDAAQVATPAVQDAEAQVRDLLASLTQ